MELFFLGWGGGLLNIPNGFLLCDGSAVSRIIYNDLYNVIGTTYGSGDEETTFNLPNLINKFLEGDIEAGIVHDPGLPNITGVSGQSQGSPGTATLRSGTGAFFVSGTLNKGFAAGGNITTYTTLNFDASKSNLIYGNSKTVQPSSVTCKYIIKY